MHVNRQVRDVFATRIDGVSGVASVSTNIGRNVRLDELPAVVISTPSDETERSSKEYGSFAGLERREIEVLATIVTEGDVGGVDDDLDDIRDDIEAAVAVDDDLGGIAELVEHTGSALDLGADEDGDRWFAFLELSWTVVVWTEYGEPEVAV